MLIAGMQQKNFRDKKNRNFLNRYTSLEE